MPGRRLHDLRVLVVDDHPLVREGITALVNGTQDFVVCGAVDSESGAVAAIESNPPDIIIVDITLNQGSGLDLIRRVSARHPEIRMLVVSMHDEFLYAPRVFKAGAHGYIEKREAPSIFVNALRRVASGKLFVSPDMTDQLLTRTISAGRQTSTDVVDTLSDRELQVLERLGRYASVREIADDLSLSVKTVETYRDRLRNKLGIANSKQLNQFAVQWLSNQETHG